LQQSNSLPVDIESCIAKVEHELQGWGFLKEVWQPYSGADYVSVFKGAATN